jgi:hypothetical protein
MKGITKNIIGIEMTKDLRRVKKTTWKFVEQDVRI